MQYGLCKAHVFEYMVILFSWGNLKEHKMGISYSFNQPQLSKEAHKSLGVTKLLSGFLGFTKPRRGKNIIYLTDFVNRYSKYSTIYCNITNMLKDDIYIMQFDILLNISMIYTYIYIHTRLWYDTFIQLDFWCQHQYGFWYWRYW